MKKINNLTFLEFHTELLGIKCIRKGKSVAKWELFWSGYNLYELLLKQTDVQIIVK
jgi:hypothetical protein